MDIMVPRDTLEVVVLREVLDLLEVVDIQALEHIQDHVVIKEVTIAVLCLMEL